MTNDPIPLETYRRLKHQRANEKATQQRNQTIEALGKHVVLMKSMSKNQPNNPIYFNEWKWWMLSHAILSSLEKGSSTVSDMTLMISRIAVDARRLSLMILPASTLHNLTKVVTLTDEEVVNYLTITRHNVEPSSMECVEATPLGEFIDQRIRELEVGGAHAFLFDHHRYLRQLSWLCESNDWRPTTYRGVGTATYLSFVQGNQRIDVTYDCGPLRYTKTPPNGATDDTSLNSLE